MPDITANITEQFNNIYLSVTESDVTVQATIQVVRTEVSLYVDEKPMGPAGVDGDSSYQIALRHGFVGTEDEWLESLKGEPGDITGIIDDSVIAAETSWSSEKINQELQEALQEKANLDHEHVIADVTGLQQALNDKANAEHGHFIGDITGLPEALSAKADLVNGVLVTSQLPALAVVEFLGSVSTEASMLALTGQKGDWCIRTDSNRTYFITGNDPTQLTSWHYIETPASPVGSVNGQVGEVVLGYGDVGAAAAVHNHMASEISDFQVTVSANSDVAANTAARHGHSNKSVLDAVTAAFTTELKASYDAAVGWGNHASAGYLNSSAAAFAYQPLNSNLTGIASLSTTAFGRSLLTQADAAATRATIGAGTSSFDGVYSSLSSIPSTFVPAVHNQAWSTITARPTTLSGYGITDAFPLAGGTLSGVAGAGFYGMPPQSVDVPLNESSVRMFVDQSQKLVIANMNSGYLRFDINDVVISKTVKFPDRNITLDNITTASTTNGTGFLKGDGSNISFDNTNYFPLAGGTITGTAGAGFIGLTTQSSAPSTPSTGFRLYADNSNRLAWKGANGYVRVFDGTANTADRTYTLPNASGTVALTSDITGALWALGGNTGLNTSNNIFGTTDNRDLRVQTNSADRLTIEGSTGNVGIGATPVSKLYLLNNSLGATPDINSGVTLENTSPAASGAQQSSPVFRQSGKGWKTATTAGSQDVYFQIFVLPVQGTNNPSATWKLQQSVNGSAPADVLSIGSATAAATFTGSVTSSNLIGPYSSNSTAVNSNLNIGSGTGAGGTFSTTSLLPSAASNVMARVIGRGSTTATPAAGVDYASWIIGDNAVTIPSSGAANVYTSLAIIQPTINTGTGTVASGSALFIKAAPASVSGLTNAYAVHIASGVVRMDGGQLLGGTTKAASAISDMQSTTQGFLVPRMTTGQKTVINSPATGLIVFDTTLGKLCIYAAGAWQTITSV